MPEVENFANESQLLTDWEGFMTFRTQAQKALEEARNAKVIGKSLEAHLTAYVSAETQSFLDSLHADLAQLLIVSDLTVTTEPAPAGAVQVDELAFTVERAAGEVCERCRRIDTSVSERSYGATICDHCASVVEENFADAVAQGFER